MTSDALSLSSLPNIIVPPPSPEDIMDIVLPSNSPFSIASQ